MVRLPFEVMQFMSPIPADHNSWALVWLTPTMENVHKPCAQEGLGTKLKITADTMEILKDAYQAALSAM